MKKILFIIMLVSTNSAIAINGNGLLEYEVYNNGESFRTCYYSDSSVLAIEWVMPCPIIY